MEFNKKGFDLFREDVQKALKAVGEKHGVEIVCGKISYSAYDFEMKLQVTKNTATVDGKKLAFEAECMYYGFQKTDYNRQFTLDGKVFRLVGFNPRSPKNNCNIFCESDGKTYKCADFLVKRAFKDM